MLKRKFVKRVSLILFVFVSIFIITLFPKEKNLDTEVSYSDDTGIIYLLNEDSLLVRLNIIYDSSNDLDLVKEIINLLTIGSEINYRISDNFNPIIPKNTKLLNAFIDKDILYLDFNKELLNISKDLEEVMIESIVFSITSNINIKGIKLMIDGVSLDRLPKTNKVLPEYLDRTIRINKVYDISSLNNINYTTIYLPTMYDDETYYLPVTKVSNNDQDKIEIIIDELKSSSTYDTNMVSYLNEETQLIDFEVMEDSILLNFNNYILDTKTSKLIEEITYSINLSIKDNYNVSSVMYMVDDKIIDNYFLLLGWECK